MAEFRNPLGQLDEVAIQGYDAERRVFHWNAASQRLYGHSSEEAMGRRLEELIIPEAMVQPVVEEIDQWLAGGPPPTGGRITLRHKDGSPVAVHSNHLSLPDAEGRPQLFCIDVPLATQHNLEDALGRMVPGESQSVDSRATFLASLSHEVRTPLNAVLGFSELLAARLAPAGRDPVASDYFDTVRSAGIELTRVLEQSLALIGAAPMVLEPHPREVSVQDILVEVAGVLLANCPEREDLLSLGRVPADLSAWVDPFLARHAISALARHAVANSRAGQPVSLFAQVRRGAADTVLVSVEDSGPPLGDQLRLKLVSGQPIDGDPYRAENQSALFHLSIAQRIALATGALLSFERTRDGLNRAVFGLHLAGHGS